MTNPGNGLDLAKASLKFFGIAIGIFAASMLIAWGIIKLHGSFTYWALIPLLLGFPITLLVNLNIAKKTIPNRRGQKDEEIE